MTGDKTTFAIVFLALSLVLSLGFANDAFAGVEICPNNGFQNDECFEDTGSIMGQKYEDLNGNGEYDEEEHVRCDPDTHRDRPACTELSRVGAGGAVSGMLLNSRREERFGRRICDYGTQRG